MEPTILVGDFILADKWTYGARIFTNQEFDEDCDPTMTRVLGFRHIRRNDVVLFNFPYYKTWDTIRMNLDNIFVKRCIGLPGDSVSVIEGFYHISGLTDTLGYIPEQRRLVRYQSELDSVLLKAATFDDSLHWDIINFGPFYIPAAGETIALTPENSKLYHKQIVYETHAVLRREDSLTYINDTLRLDYTFRHNWYFMAGDMVMNSQDSRYIGLIPEDYIIGRASLVILSKDKFTRKLRWDRVFKRIK